jgi:HSF-type DNA-binding
MTVETANNLSSSTMEDGYHDYSQATKEDTVVVRMAEDDASSGSVATLVGEEGAGAAKSNNNASLHRVVTTSDQNFPVKLHYMLHELEDDGLAHIVSWAPHGRSFVVHKQDVFIEMILNRYVSKRVISPTLVLGKRFPI